MLLLHASARTCDANARVYCLVRTGEKHETLWGHCRLSFPLELTLLPSDKIWTPGLHEKNTSEEGQSRQVCFLKHIHKA